MKYILFICFATFSQVVLAQGPQHVSSTSFKKLVDSGNGVILDVRTPGEFERGYIEGATLIDVNNPNFISKVNLLAKDSPIYVYCLTGSRSQAVANYLSQNGYGKVSNLARGILEWQQNGYPIAQGSQAHAVQGEKVTQGELNHLIASNGVLLLNFHAPWCAPCKKMAPTIGQVKQDYQGKVHVEKVDIEQNKNLQQSYNVQSIPTTIVFKNGKEVWRQNGILSYDEITKNL